MTEEEIKAYVNRIENTPLEKVREVLPSFNLYNVDLVMSKICEVLAENVNILRRLNNENDKNECFHWINYDNKNSSYKTSYKRTYDRNKSC